MSRACRAVSSSEDGEGKKPGRTAGWFKWKAENTLRKKVRPGRNVTLQKGGPALSVTSPPALQAKENEQNFPILNIRKSCHCCCVSYKCCFILFT